MVVRLHEVACGEDAESKVPEAAGDRQRTRPGRDRLVRLAEVYVDGRHEGAGPAAPTVIVQPLGEGVGLQQALERLRDFTELVQRLPQLEADIETRLQGGLGLRERLDDAERLIKIGPGIVEC